MPSITPSGLSFTPPPGKPGNGTFFDHVVIIVMENEGLTNICGSGSIPPCAGSSSPYLSSLAKQYEIATNYVSLANVSQPNYLGLIGGSTFGCPVTCNNLNNVTLVDRLASAGLTWKGYMENQNVNSGCDTSSQAPYEHEHNPFTSFTTITTNATRCSNIVLANPGSCSVTDCALIDDLNIANAPNFMWLTPNDCNNMHADPSCTNGCTTGGTLTCVSDGDQYLSTLIPDILNSYSFTAQRSALFVTFDEGTGFCPAAPTSRDCVYSLWAGPQTTHGGTVTTKSYNHYSFLHTVEYNWNLTALTASDKNAPLMDEFFTNATLPSATSWNPLVTTCGPPKIMTLEQFLGNTNSSLGGATLTSSPLNPGITNTTVGANNVRSWLTSSPRTPANWTSPGPNCSGHFVQIDGVQRDFFTNHNSQVLSNSTYMPVNGGSRYPNGTRADTVFNVFTPGYITCDSGNKTGCMHSLIVVIDHDWKAAGYCGPLTTCDNNEIGNETAAYRSLIDIQGFAFWNANGATDPLHNYSGWEIHALTAWRKEGQSPSITTSATPSSVLVVPGQSGSTNITTTGFNLFSGGVNLTATVTPVSGTAGLPPTTSFSNSQPTLLPDGFVISKLIIATAANTTGAYLITIGASNPNGTIKAPPITVSLTMVGFSISASPSTLPIITGSSANSTVTLVSKGSFQGFVTLTIHSTCGCALPTLGSSSIKLTNGGTNTTTLHISASGNGDATITVNATSTSPSFVASTSVFVRVSDFGFTTSTPLVSIDAGVGGSANLFVSSLNHFNGTIIFSTSTSGGGPAPTLNATSVTIHAGQTTLIVLSFNSTNPITYVVTVNAVDGTLSHQLTVTFIVQDFNISSSRSIQVNIGSTAPASLTIQGLNGFSRSISLTDSVPAGLSCSAISPTTISGSGSASISCGATVATNYNLTITGTSGPLIHTIHITFNIVDFTIAASSVSPASVNVGSLGNSTITLTGLNGFSEKIALSFSAPLGLTCSLSSSKVTLPPSPGTSILSCRSSTPTDYTVTVTGVNGTLTHSTVAILFHFVDFTVTALPSTSLTLVVGQADSSTSISLTGLNSFTGLVSLSVTISSLGPSASPTLPSLNLHSTGCRCNSTVLNVSAGTIAGIYILNITGTNGQLRHSAFVTITVQDFTIGASPTSVTTLAGATGASTITLTGLDGFAGTASVNPAVTPIGLSCTLTSTSVTFNGTSTLSCTGSEGTYSVTVTGTSKGITHSTIVAYIVQDFTVTASPTNLTVFLGTSAQSTITVTGLQGFTGNVTLGESVSPTVGLTCTLSTTGVSLNKTRTSGTSNLSCVDTALSGSFNVTVTGTSGSLSHSATVDYTVGAAFSLTAHPTSVSLLAGSTANSTITVTFAPTFIGTVNLNETISPGAGLSCSLSVTSFTATGNSTLSCKGSAGSYAVTVTGKSGGNTASAQVAYTVQDFTMTASPVSVSDNSGAPGASTITVTSQDGFTGAVAFAVTTNSTNLTCSLSSPSVTGGSGSSTLSCASSSPGNYLATVSGTSSTLLHSLSVVYHVQDFTVGASPTSVNVNVGVAVTSTTTIAPLNGFNGTVTLFVSTNSTSLSCSLSSSSITNGSGSSTLSCTGSIGGNFLATINATNGPLSHSVSVTIHVQDFTTTVSPTIVTVNAGVTGTSTTSVAPVNGFTGTVALAVTTNSTNMSCTLSPTSIAGGSGTSTLSCSASVAGNYLATVTGTNGGLSHSATITYHIQNFTVTASPASVTQNVGISGSSTITIAPVNGFTGTVAVAVTTNSTNLSCTLSSTSIAGGSGTSTLSCTGSVAGNYLATVASTSGTLSHSATVTLHIQDFTVTAGPASVTVNTGITGTSTITVTALNGFSGTVSLVVTTNSTNLSCTLSPTSITGGSGTSTLSCSASVAGNYLATVTGTNGGLSHSATVTFHVQDFTVAASPTTVTVNVGVAGTSTTTIAPANGFAGTVTLAVTTNSTNLSCTLSVTSIASSSGTSTLSCTGIVAGNYLATVTGTSGPLSHVATITYHVQDFTVIANPTSATVNVGVVGTSTVNVAPVNGFTGTVNLAVTTNSTILSCSLSATSIAGGSGTSTLSCTGIMAGNYLATINGTSGTLSHSTPVTYHVQDFTISASPTSVSGNVSAALTSTITVAAVDGFTGTVSLADTVSPATGLTCTLSPTSVTGGSGTSTLSCTASTSGSYTVTVTGMSGSLSHSAAVTYSINVPDFSITASPTNVAVPAGSASTSTITASSINAFTGTVSLSSTVSPSTGLTCSLSPTSVNLGTSAASTLSCSGSAGLYTVTVSGTSGSLSHTTTVTVTVQDFTISANPTTVSGNAGAAGTSTITVTALQGFGGTVGLASTVAPTTGLTCTLAPTSVTGSGTSTLSCSGSAGAYTVIVTGTSGSLSHSATVTYNIQDFTVSASPTSVIVNAGTAGTSTITVTSLDSFAGTVALTSAVSPAPSLTCGLLPTSVTLGTSGTSTLSCSGTAGIYTVTVTGSSSGISHSATVTYTIRDFTISANPTSLSFASGGTGHSAITITSLNGFAGTVGLTDSVSPSSGLTCTLSPSSVTVSGGGSGASTLSCTSSTAGTFNVTVTGTSGSLTNSAFVTVSSGTAYTVTASPTTITVLAGTTGTSAITVTAQNGFTGTVSLISSISPSNGLTCTLSPTSVTLGATGTSTLSCSGTAGVYTVTVTGSNGPNNVPTTVTFTDQDFSLSASPSSVTSRAGANGNSTITVSALNGFTGSVSLADAISPLTGLTCTLTPTSVTGSGTSALSCSGSAGSYTLTVTGSSSSLSHSVTVTYTIQDFTVSASPTSVTILGGTSGTSIITITSLQGFTGSVTLTDTVSPATGLTCTLTPSSVTLGTSGTSTLSCSGSTGAYAVTVTGNSGALSRPVTVTYTVQDFTIAASPTSATVLASVSGTSTITVTALNGFTGTVSLTSTASPTTGLTCALTPSSVSGSGTSTLSCSGSAGSYAVTVTGTSSSLSHSATVTFTVQDFTIAASPTTGTVLAGASGTSTVTITALQGFGGVVDLTATISPSTGLACTLTPTSVTGSGTSILSCNGSAGAYTVTVTGTSSNLSHQATVTYTVQDFTIAANPTSVSVNSGTTGTSTITVAALDGFSGVVSLTATVLPTTGLGCTLTPNSITSSGTSTLSCSGSVGSYTVIVTGTSGSLSHSATVSYAVKDFTITAGPTSVTILAGASGTSTITITPLQGFTGTVTLAQAESPSTGLTCTLTPTSIALGASGTSTLACSGSAGTYTVTVTGTSGTLSHSSTVTYTVQDFTIAASPTNVTVSAGVSGTSTIMITALQSFSGLVSLSSTVSPTSGLTCTFTPTSLSGSGASTLSCSGNSGSYTVTVTGTSSTLSHSTTVSYITQDFTIAASPTIVTVNAGTAGSSTITVTGQSGFSGAVNLGTNSTSCTVTPNSVAGSGTASLSCNFSTSNMIHVGITGTSGSLSHSITVNFVVQDFSIAASPVYVTVNAGSAGPSTITVTAQDGFAGLVNLSTNSTACTITPGSVTGSGSGTLSCAFATQSTNTVFVTGTSGSLSHLITVTYIVQDFTITASPISVTGNVGSTVTSTLTVTGLNSFAGVVGLASNSTACAFSTSSITGSGASTVSCTFNSASIITVSAIGTSGSLTHSANVTFTIQDFTISASPTIVTDNAGSSGTSTVTITALDGFAGTVGLTSNSTACTVSPTSVTGAGSATLSCTYNSAGNFHVGVKGTSASLSRSLTLTYRVQDFLIAASPQTINVDVGSSGTSSINLTSQNGFSGIVSLVSNSTSCTLAPTSVTGSGSSTLSCTFTSTGIANVIVAGTSGGLSHSATVAFTIQDYTISASPTGVTDIAGSAGTSTVTVTPINAFTGAVVLGVSSNSTNLSCTLVPSTITGGSGASTLSCVGTSAGNYLATITGTSGSLAHSTTVRYHVEDFAIATSPTSVPVIVGVQGTSTVTISPINGFTSAVSLVTSTNSTNLFCNILPSSVTGGSGTSSLVCTGSVAGNYLATVTGSTAALSHSATAVYLISDFTITASSPSALAGDSAQSTITITALNGFTGTVGLTDSAPAGLTCNAITPSGITGSGTATVSCSSATAGTYSITVTGASGTLSHSTTAAVTVTDFTISASSPAPVDVSTLTSSSITVVSLNGFTGTVSLTDTVPTGLSCGSLAPNIISASGTASVTCSSSVAGTYKLTITGTSGTLSHTATATFTIQDFTITANPTSLIGNVNSAQTSTITIGPANSFTNTVSLTEAISPSTGMTCSLSLTSITGGSGTSTLSCTATVPGSYTVTVTGTSGSLSHSATVTYSIAIPDFSISASPSSVGAYAGVFATSTITVQSLNAFMGTVTLSSSTSPSNGLSCTMNPTSITLTLSTTSGSSSLSCSGSPGVYTVTVTGTSALLVHSATVTITVQDFTVSVSPSTVTTNAGAVGTSTVVVTGVNGFAGSVNLATTVSPTTGLTCSLSSTSITLGTSGTSTLSCNGSAGSYTVTITATSGSLSHTATADYTVEDFAITAAPTSVTINAGAAAGSTVTVSGESGFTASVVLSFTASPSSGLTCSLTPPSISISGTSPTGTSTLSCSGSAGTYVVTVTGSGGGLSRTTSISYTIADFEIAASPSSVSVFAGATGTSTVTLTSINGYSGTVSLTDTVSPSTGLVCGLSPASVTVGTSGTTSTLSCSGSSGIYAVVVTGTGTSLAHTATVTVTVQDFALSANPTSLTIFPGPSGASSTITATGTNGFTGTVSLLSTAPPTSGLSCSLNPTSVALSSSTTSASSSLTCTASSPNSGSFTITVTALIGGLSHSTTVIFTVANAFSVSASPTSITTLSGAPGSSTISVTYASGFTGTVTLTDSVSSTALSCTLGTTTFTGSGTTPLSCSGTAGVYTVTITGTSTANTATASVTYTVQDFSLVTSPASLTLLAGASGSSTLIATSVNGFTGTIALSLTISPVNGLTCSLLTTTITLSSTSPTGTASLSCSGTAGVYTVTLTGTSRGLTNAATVAVTVQDFTMTGAPSSVSVNTGSAGASTVTITSLNGFANTISISSSIVPLIGLSCTVSPTSVSLTSTSTVATSTLSCTGTLAGSYTVTVTGTSGSLSHTATIIYTVEDFTVSANPTSVTINANAEGNSTITATSIDGFTGSVALTETVSPSSGLSCSLTPAVVSLGTSGSSTLSCIGGAGSYTVTLTGSSSGLSHSTPISFTVQDFTLVASPTSVTVNSGATGTSTLIVTSLDGFAGTVALASSVSSSSGLTCTVSPSSIVLGASGTATLSCNGSPGSYVVTVSGTSAGLSHSATVTYTVQDFTLAANPTTVTVTAGASSISTITTTSLQGFAGPITLTASVSPSSGLTCSLSPTNVVGSGSSTLSCSGTSGTYMVTVTGTSNTLSHAVTVAYTVQDFAIAASPTTVAVSAGAAAVSTITVTSLDGFAGTISMGVKISPSTGLTCNLTPASLTLGTSQTSTLSCNGMQGVYTATVTGNGASISHVTTVTITVQDFTITSSPASVSLLAGATGNSAITVTSLNGFTGTVTLSSSTAPTGITCTLTPTSITLGTAASSTLSCFGPTGTFIVSVTGASGSLSHTASVTFSIQDFTISAGPTSVPINVGQTGDSTISITAVNGFTGSVTLTTSISPSSGLTCTLTPTSVTGSGTSTISCKPSMSGSFTATVTGASGTLSHSTTVTYSVAVPDFSVTASPTSITAIAGTTGISTITVGSINAFTGTVALSSSVSPSTGLTCTLSPNSANLGASVTSTLSCNGSAGSYTVTVTGTSGSLSHTASVTYAIQDFSVSASPTSATVLVGGSANSTITVAALQGFTGTVTLATSISPSTGLTCTLGSTSLILGTTAGSTQSCSGSAGQYIVTITGSSGSLSHAATATVTVEDFTIASSPTGVTVLAGTSKTSAITLTGLDGFSGTVGLTPSISPSAGLTCALSPTSLPGSGSSTLSCSGPAGIYTVTVTGKSGSLSHSATVIYTVQDFTITASQLGVTVLAGASGATTLTVAALDGFSGSVGLTAMVLPSAGLTCTLTPTSLAGSGTSSLSCNGNAGSYSVTVAGTSGPLSHSALVTYTVEDFTISGNPTSATVSLATKATSTITVASVNGFSGTVAVTVTSNSTSLSCTIDLTTITGGSGTSILSCTGSVAGNYLANVTGTSGTDSHSSSFIVSVLKNNPTITTSLSASTIPVGGSVSDSATLASSFQATGTVTYEYFSGSACSTNPTSVGLVTLTAHAVPTSPLQSFNAAGSFSFDALYSGDLNNVPTRSACESLVVTMAAPTIALTVSANNAHAGGKVSLSSSIAAGFQSTGTVVYEYVTGSLCPATGVKTIGTVTVSNGAVSSLSPQSFNSAGNFRIFAVYSGDYNNAPAVSSCQLLTVAPNLSVPGTLSVGAGSSVHFMVNSTDPDTSQPITLTASNLPDGATFPASQASSLVSSTFAWTPSSAGNYSVTFIAQAGGVSTTYQLTIHVTAASRAAPLPILQYSIFGVIGFLAVLIATLVLRRFQNPRRKLKP